MIQNSVFSQNNCIKLWSDGKMPNSKGLKLERIEERERVTQMDTPEMYSFFTSKEENTGAAVLIFPPGGYQKLTYNIAGIQLAKWFNTFGVNAFVVMYRLPTSPDLIDPVFGPITDAQRAIKIVRYNAEKWGVDKNKIGVMGCSAGGGLAANLATFRKDFSVISDEIDDVSFIPNFQILISGVISMSQNVHKGSYNSLLGKNTSKRLEQMFSGEHNVSVKTPPAFIVCANNDPVVSPLNSVNYYQALLNKNISASLHVFSYGEHSISLRNNPMSTDLWVKICEKWLSEIKIVP